jgi:NADH:ubiquinone oxidoreductase subunit C
MKKQTAPILAKKIGKPYKQDKGAIWLEVKSMDIKKAWETVHEATERITDISVYDTGENRLEVMYRFYVGGAVLNIKTCISAEKPGLPTCTDLFPGALMMEREQHDMFGVFFYGHPNLEPVLFADSTPKAPLRKKIVVKDVVEDVKENVKEEKDAAKK